jgi:hypothetical protein
LSFVITCVWLFDLQPPNLKGFSALQNLLGIAFGAGLVWQSFQSKIRIGTRLGLGDEFPNPGFLKLVFRVFGSIIVVVSTYRLWLSQH